MDEPAAPPVAARRPHVLRHHGDERTDDWYWLRERENPDVRAYLEAENTYTGAATDHTAALRERLYEEIVSRVRQTDVSAPVGRDHYEYFLRTLEGSQYGVHCRRPRARSGDVDRLPDAAAAPGTPPDEAVLLDENRLAADVEYLALGAASVSPDHRRLAYSVDTTGGERYTLRIRELGTGSDLADEIPGTYYGVAWANDNATVFYTRPDAAMRPWQVWRHTIGTPTDHDELTFQENDERFFLSVGRTRSRRVIVIASESKTTSESWLVDADDPTAPPTVVAPRVQGVEYHVEHHDSPEHGSRLLIVTNDGDAPNFRLVVAPMVTPRRDTWQEVVPHQPEVRVEDVDAFRDHIVVSERADGLQRIRVLDPGFDGDSHVVALPDAAYTVGVGPNLESETPTLRYEYASLQTPPSSFDYDVVSRRSTLVRRQPVLGRYDPDEYETERLWATAPDGTDIPISLVRRSGPKPDGGAPLLLYGYGSYEVSIDPGFSTVRLSLLERGVSFAIAHVRGGGELGRGWYDDGKLAHKPNTFDDFVACAEHLVANGYTAPDRLAARGGSAGGLLMGAVANLRPDLFRAIVAEVPFVDCLTTILDPDLPLTVTEWEEWGDPITDAEIYRVMKAYSPYDNVEAKDYPAMLVTAGINDPRVQYWEPAKWVAKLRATKTDDRVLLLKTELGAGHGGRSGRYDAWRDEAFVLAFVLDQLGVA